MTGFATACPHRIVPSLGNSSAVCNTNIQFFQAFFSPSDAGLHAEAAHRTQSRGPGQSGQHKLCILLPKSIVFFFHI
jgi:hypothetical protein